MLTSKPIRSDADARAYLAEFHADRLEPFGDASSYSYKRTVTCRRCGGAGYYPTPQHGACYDCGGRPVTYVETVTVQLKKLAQRLKREDRKAAKIRAEVEAQQAQAKIDRAAFLAAHEGLEEALALDVSILQSFREQLEARGKLSERQVEVAFDVAAKTAKDEQTKTDAPEGRQTFSGTIVSCKESFGEYGASWRVTIRVETEAGHWIANGTAPAALLRACDWERDDYTGEQEPQLKGKSVTLKATLSRGNEPSFAFFKRPALVG